MKVMSLTQASFGSATTNCRCKRFGATTLSGADLIRAGGSQPGRAGIAEAVGCTILLSQIEKVGVGRSVRSGHMVYTLSGNNG
jgi:hypothetical protein